MALKKAEPSAEVVYSNYKVLKYVKLNKLSFLRVALVARDGETGILITPCRYSYNTDELNPILSRSIYVPYITTESDDASSSGEDLIRSIDKALEQLPFFDGVGKIVYKGDSQCVKLNVATAKKS